MSHLIALMGAPGAGKSTWAKGQDVPVVSTDAIRHGADMRMVYRHAMAEVEYRLAHDMDVVFDATLANPVTREHLLEVAARTDARTTLRVFGTPLSVCLERQAGRDIPVPDERVRRSWQAIASQLDDLSDEAWNVIVFVRGADGEAGEAWPTPAGDGP